MNKITNFKIEKLHGYKTYDIEIKDNILILVGENGAGKSTLMHGITGFHPIDSGEILVRGKPVNFKSTEDLNKHSKIWSVLMQIKHQPLV